MQQSLLHRGLCRIGIALIFGVGPLWADSPYRLNPRGKESRYTQILIRLLNEWPRRPVTEQETDPNFGGVVAYSTPEENFYIGVGHSLIINAPLEKTKATLDAVDSYIHFYPGYKKIQVTAREPAFWESEWEQIVPVFFVSNLNFKLIHWSDHRPSRSVIRYQMKESADLKACDGIIVLEARGNQTRFDEYTFADTDLGILKTLAPNQIWTDTVRDRHLSSLGLKIRTENPDWDFTKVKETAASLLSDETIRRAVEQKKPLPF